jgi:hypothetical protein
MEWAENIECIVDIYYEIRRKQIIRGNIGADRRIILNV